MESDGFKQLMMLIMREERIYVSSFCRQYRMVFWTINLRFVMMKLRSIWMGMSALRTRGAGAGSVLKYDQKIGVWCAVTAAWMLGPIFFEHTLNSEWYISDILQPIFLRALQKKSRRMVNLFKVVLQHTHSLSLHSCFKWGVWRQTDKLQIVACKVSRLKSLWFLSVGKPKTMFVYIIPHIEWT
jgi:hypothetical protein